MIAQVALCVPHTFLWSVKQVVQGTYVELGAQSVYFEKKGVLLDFISVAKVAAQHT